MPKTAAAKSEQVIVCHKNWHYCYVSKGCLAMMMFSNEKFRANDLLDDDRFELVAYNDHFEDGELYYRIHPAKNIRHDLWQKNYKEINELIKCYHDTIELIGIDFYERSWL